MLDIQTVMISTSISTRLGLKFCKGLLLYCKCLVKKIIHSTEIMRMIC